LMIMNLANPHITKTLLRLFAAGRRACLQHTYCVSDGAARFAPKAADKEHPLG
jgi:hypothetical protein